MPAGPRSDRTPHDVVNSEPTGFALLTISVLQRRVSGKRCIKRHLWLLYCKKRFSILITGLAFSAYEASPGEAETYALNLPDLY